MTVSSTTTRNSYTGDGSTTVFAYTFKIFDDDDITVILRTTATGTETVQTKTTHYSVSGVGNTGGGNITFVSAPASTQTVVLLRQTAQTQTTDYTPNDPFPAASHEDALDKMTLIIQDQQDELDRAIKLSRTNTMTSTEFTVGAATRANKILAFDGSGELSVTQELGTFQGNWAASTAYYVRDIIKDTSNNNIYICNTAHTSSGSQPISSNTDSAKWDLLVDAASATTSATAAAASATAAASSATSAATAQTNAETAETNAETAQAAAETAQTGAETAQAAAESARDSALAAYDNFDDRYLGVKTSDPTLDNDGNALVAGALYFNSTDSSMKVYDGSSWYDAYADGALFARKANNLSDLADAATARTNLGLGTAATSASTDFVAVTGDAMTGDLTFGDANYAYFGASNDLKVGHTGSASVIQETGTGDLYIDATNFQIRNGAGTETLATLTTDGAVTLYYDNASKLATTSSGIDVTGTITFDGGTTSADLNFGDNDKAVFGAGSDLQIYHDASDSHVADNGTGRLLLRTNGTSINFFKDTSETMAVMNVDGAVELYYDNSKKIETTSSGIDVTGTVTADGLTVESSASGAEVIGATIDNTSTAADSKASLRLEVGSQEAYITAHRVLANSGTDIVISSENSSATRTDKIRIAEDGDISFYDSTGVTQGFFWDASTQRLGLGTTSPTSTLDINGSLSKSSGSFRIDHPIKPETHDLVHSFVEAPQADNIYRGKVDLIDGSATVNIDAVAGMTEGTFAALNRDIQCFTSNESGWTAVKGSVSGNVLTITAQDNTCTDTVSWLVIGERQDQHMYDTEWTDEDGRVIVEPEKVI